MNRFVVLAALALASALPLRAQTNTITKAGDGLWFMYYDSTQSKSTIVEFDFFVAMIEVPVKHEGGGARVLREHAEGGEKAIRTLKEAFPGKPLRYVIHSHWHPHSISSGQLHLLAQGKVQQCATNPNSANGKVDCVSLPRFCFSPDSHDYFPRHSSINPFIISVYGQIVFPFLRSIFLKLFRQLHKAYRVPSYDYQI